jgi:hypothetical protein
MYAMTLKNTIATQIATIKIVRTVNIPLFIVPSFSKRERLPHIYNDVLALNVLGLLHTAMTILFYPGPDRVIE